MIINRCAASVFTLGFTGSHDLEKATLRSKFVNAAVSFDAASRERSPTEQQIEAGLRKAIGDAKGFHMTVPHPELPIPSHLSCSPDFTKCPLGWELQNGMCSKVGPTEKGSQCNSKCNLGSFTQAQKEALAVACGWTFPCQTSECKVNFHEQCPVLWHEEHGGSCIAPASYVGECGSKISIKGLSCCCCCWLLLLLVVVVVVELALPCPVLDVGGMTPEAKQVLAYRCGVRLLFCCFESCCACRRSAFLLTGGRAPTEAKVRYIPVFAQRLVEQRPRL